MKFTLCDYFDVWGNAKEGYEINNWSYPFGREYTLDADISTDEKIIQWLKEEGYIKKHVRKNMLEIVDECNGLIMIYQKRDMKPLYCIEYEQ